MSMRARCARVSSIVESTRVEPEPVHGATQTESLRRGEETAIFVVMLPLLGWVYFFPFLGHRTKFDELL